jgi:hypothetical protein
MLPIYAQKGGQHETARSVGKALQYLFLLVSLSGLMAACGGADAAAAAQKTAGGTSGATCNNREPVALPTVLSGPANLCLVTSGTIDSVSSRLADTFTINGVSYANVASNIVPARRRRRTCSR